MLPSTNNELNRHGFMDLNNPNEPRIGIVNTVFNVSRPNEDVSQAPVIIYRVLATDFDNFALLWTCNSNTTMENGMPVVRSEEFAYVLGRQRQLTPAARGLINSFINSHLRTTEGFRMTVQDRCQSGAKMITYGLTLIIFTIFFNLFK